MYRPNFCCDCGKKILRLHWHPWTSTRFCDDCATRLRKDRLRRPAIAAVLLLSVGLVTGRALRPAPPPLVIQRGAADLSPNKENQQTSSTTAAATITAEDVYICGARTKKGTPCSRRVHGNVRCWQHKGLPAILPLEKLVVKE